MIIIAAYTEEIGLAAGRLGLPWYRASGEDNDKSIGSEYFWVRSNHMHVIAHKVGLVRQDNPTAKFIVGDGRPGGSEPLTQATSQWNPWAKCSYAGLRVIHGVSVGTLRPSCDDFFLHEADFYRGDLSWVKAMTLGIELAYYQEELHRKIGHDLRAAVISARLDERLIEKRYGDTLWAYLDDRQDKRDRNVIVQKLCDYLQTTWGGELHRRGQVQR